MKREKAAKLLESGVLQAYAEGEVIQIHDDLNWVDLSGADLLFHAAAENYRVKPEPLHDWVVMGTEKRDCFIVYCKPLSWMKRFYGSQPDFCYRQLVPVTEE